MLLTECLNKTGRIKTIHICHELLKHSINLRDSFLSVSGKIELFIQFYHKAEQCWGTSQNKEHRMIEWGKKTVLATSAQGSGFVLTLDHAWKYRSS